MTLNKEKKTTAHRHRYVKKKKEKIKKPEKVKKSIVQETNSFES